MMRLFQGYKIASDVIFLAYIELQETQYMQGSSLAPELLTTQALNNYNTKIISNTWGAQSDKQCQIVALSADLKTIIDNNTELSKTVLEKSRTSPVERKCRIRGKWYTIQALITCLRMENLTIGVHITSVGTSTKIVNVKVA